MDLGTRNATKVVGAVGLLAVAGLGWMFGVGPQAADLAAVREQVTTIQDQNGVLATQLAGLVKQQQQLGDTRSTARRLERLFPPTADQPGLFEVVTTAAVDAGIGAQGVTTLTPTPPVIGDGTTAASTSGSPAPAGAQLARQTVTVAVTGTYDQTQQLLVNLEHMRRAYLVTSVSIAGGADSATYTTTITGDMFVMPPVPDPGKTVEVSSTTDSEG